MSRERQGRVSPEPRTAGSDGRKGTPMFKDSTEDFVGVPVSKFPHEARKYLSAFDRNGDGMIDLGELEHAARTIEEARRGNLTVDMFPERLRATVRALDDEGDGVLEIDEIAEMVEMYAALKEANKNGEISIATLPKAIQPTLKVFDVDGDGTVAPMELARGAELYIESKKTVKKLTRLSVALLLLMGVMLAAITGLVFAVVELSKETTVSADGVTTVKGSTEAQKSGSLSLDPARDGAVLLDAPLERVNDVGGHRRLLDEHPLARVDRTKLHHTTRRILSEQGPSEVLVAVLQEAYIKTTCQTVKTLGSVLDIPFTTKGGVQNTLSISSMRCESLEGTGQANTVGGNEGKNYLLNCPNDETRPGECGIYLVQTPEEVDRRRHLLSQYRAPLSLSNDGTTWEFNVSNGHYDVLNDYDNNPPQTTVFQTDASVCTREVFDQDCEERTNDACMCFGGGSSKFDQNTMCYRGLGRLQGETEDKIMCKMTFNQGIWDGMSAELWHTPCHLRTPQECEYYYDLGAMAEEWWEMGDPNSDFDISCFPGDAVARVEGVPSPVALRELKVGDRVLSATADGTLAYSPIVDVRLGDNYGFTHRITDRPSRFAVLSLSSGATLRLSPAHFVPVDRGCAGAAGAFAAHELVAARDVAAGDCVFEAADGAGAAAVAARVVGVSATVERDAYNFHTREGTIVVDGVVASVFTESSWPLGYGHLLRPMQRVAGAMAALGWGP
eukprot:PRCOL_00002424-RA